MHDNLISLSFLHPNDPVEPTFCKPQISQYISEILQIGLENETTLVILFTPKRNLMLSLFNIEKYEFS